MMARKVLVSNIMMLNERERFDRVLRQKGYEPVFAQVDQYLDEAACVAYVGDVDGWLAGDDQITRNVLLKALPALKVISKWGTGVDSIDLIAARDLGVPIRNSAGAFSDAVAEVAIGYVLMLARNLGHIDRAVRAGEWPKPRSTELVGKVLGLVGFGAIGQGIARRAAALGMSIVFYDPFVSVGVDGDWRAEPVSFEALARDADVVCIACNLTDGNHHLVDAAFLARMKATASLINVSRGPLVDEAALIAALRDGRIAGAGLDVYETEPLPASSPLLALDNVVLGSHNANNGVAAVERVHQNTLKNLDDVFKLRGPRVSAAQ